MESHSLEISQIVEDWVTHPKQSKHLRYVERGMLNKLMTEIHLTYEFPVKITLDRTERVVDIPLKGECSKSHLTELRLRAIVVGVKKESGNE